MGTPEAKESMTSLRFENRGMNAPGTAVDKHRTARSKMASRSWNFIPTLPRSDWLEQHPPKGKCLNAIEIEAQVTPAHWRIEYHVRHTQAWGASARGKYILTTATDVVRSRNERRKKPRPSVI